MIYLVSKLFRAYRLYNSVKILVIALTCVFQSSFELTGYITYYISTISSSISLFQSSFELTGYITYYISTISSSISLFQSSFELTGYITLFPLLLEKYFNVSKLFRAYRLYNVVGDINGIPVVGFKALSSLQVI